MSLLGTGSELAIEVPLLSRRMKVLRLCIARASRATEAPPKSTALVLSIPTNVQPDRPDEALPRTRGCVRSSEQLAAVTTPISTESLTSRLIDEVLRERGPLARRIVARVSSEFAPYATQRPEDLLPGILSNVELVLRAVRRSEERRVGKACR